MSNDDLRIEAQSVLQQVWFVRGLNVADRTNSTVTVHLFLTPNLLVQIFLSERSGRFSLALIGPTGRLYGRDREHGVWHRHPFEQPDVHEPTPGGMSPRPLEQFLAEGNYSGQEKIFATNCTNLHELPLVHSCKFVQFVAKSVLWLGSYHATSLPSRFVPIRLDSLVSIPSTTHRSHGPHPVFASIDTMGNRFLRRV